MSRNTYFKIVSNIEYRPSQKQSEVVATKTSSALLFALCNDLRKHKQRFKRQQLF